MMKGENSRDGRELLGCGVRVLHSGYEINPSPHIVSLTKPGVTLKSNLEGKSGIIQVPFLGEKHSRMKPIGIINSNTSVWCRRKEELEKCFKK